MSTRESVDAVVVGAGPNGLAAAITLAEAGHQVTVFESAETVGGGCRSLELTLPGYVHDVCSAVHPLAAASPFFRALELGKLGLELVHSPLALAHPLDDGPPVQLFRSVEETASGLGEDGPAYRKLMGPMVQAAEVLVDQLVGPFRLPRHPFKVLAFGVKALRSVHGLADSRFSTTGAKAVLGGIGAHSMLSLERSPTAGIALLLGLLAHSAGWPVVRGGSQVLADTMARRLESLGGKIVTGFRVGSMSELPAEARAYLFDVTPRQLVQIASDQLPDRYVARLARYRYGPGVFKMDWALDGPIPWKRQECAGAITVHLGGTLEQIARSEQTVVDGGHAERPFVLLSQPSAFDATRAPEGKQTAWAYCHVPHGSTFDMTERIESQIERFAPGFRDRILQRSTLTCREMERYNANYIGGDINGGVQDLGQLFTRPVARLNPYTTPNPRIYICSSSTPPGGGVHGMCGYFAARAALKRALK